MVLTEGSLMKRCVICGRAVFDELDRCPHGECGGELENAGACPATLSEALEEIASMNPAWPFDMQLTLSNLTDLAPNLTRERAMLRMFFTAVEEADATRLFSARNLTATLSFVSEFLSGSITETVGSAYKRLLDGPNGAGLRREREAAAERAAGADSPRMAFVLLSRAARTDRTDALYWLGYCHEFGIGTWRDAERARECYEEAAASGQPDARQRLEALRSAHTTRTTSR